MENLTQPYPWYDDRVEAVRKTDAVPEAETVHASDEPARYTPKEIYAYLDRKVWKQEDAKKAASVIMYNCLHGVRSTAMFIGPSGCGKTHIWRCLKEICPNRIEIMDASSLTQDGWKGSTKWKDLLRSPIFRSGNHSILVCDESDKMLAPKFSYGENVSPSIQSEGLTMLEGARVDVKIDSVIHSIDTATISFVLCGAFSNKAHAVAEKSAGSRIGFGFLSHIGEQYKADIRLTPQKRRELAEQAFQTGLGVRGMTNQIRQLMDDAIFEDCERRCFEF